MTNLEFKYWIKGFMELADEPHIDQSRLEIIQHHVDLVLDTEGHIDADIVRFVRECSDAL